MSKKRAKKKVLKAVYVLLVVLCLLCIMGMLLYLRRDHKEEEVAEEQHTEVVEQYVDEKAEEEKAELPIDFASLQQINPEIYAWIRIPDTNVDYPILQREGEDQSFYLDHDMYGEEQKAGSIYTECYNSKDFTDPNTIIYGHNMKNGSMFRALNDMTDKEYFWRHHIFCIDTGSGFENYEVISCYETVETDLSSWRISFEDDADYEEWLKAITKRCTYDCADYDGSKKTITLSTCRGKANGPGRFIVHLQKKN